MEQEKPRAASVDAVYDTTYYQRSGASELMERLTCEALLAQGPMGSVLMQGEDAANIPAAFWNLAEPQTVERLHALYANAGAQVLITNTFQASAPALERDGIIQGVDEVNRAAVDCARACRPEFVVGSVGPCGIDWFQEDSPEFRAARSAYRQQVHSLLAAGVDAVLLETFVSVRDLTPALMGARDVADGMPVLVSCVVDEDGNLLGDGLSLEGFVVWAEKHGACAVGVNCCSIEAAHAAVPRLVAAARTPVMVRPHGGLPERDVDGVPVWNEQPAAFAEACRAWCAAGARLVGGCCGTTPVTTAAMAEALSA